MTGIRLWIFSVVLWVPKSKGSSEAKASPRMRMASRWASSMAYIETKGRGERVTRLQPQIPPQFLILETTAQVWRA